jgi:peptide/nickel transport system permease protein
MTTHAGSGVALAAAEPSRIGALKAALRGNRFAVFVLVLFAVLVIFGESIAPYSAYSFDASAMLVPPTWDHIFGTDEFGRDVFSRILAGARPTLIVALLSAVLGVALGTATGLVTGYAGGVVDEVVMRIMDAAMSFPALILAMLVVVMLGGSSTNLVIALGVVFWPRSARLVRSVTLELAHREFVESAMSRGEHWVSILVREILPNVRMIIILDLSLRFTYGILLSASLAYLGIGVTAPTPAWGLMVKDGQQFIEIAPWLIVFPCLAVTLTAILMLALGEKLRRRVNLSGVANRDALR